MRETKLKSSKGITLIALVITIIVLLILAGVAIAMLSGDNGILKQAANAKTEHEIAQKKEETSLTDMEAIIDFQTSGTKSKFKFKNGYLTGVKFDETVESIYKGLPTDYKIYTVDEQEIAKDSQDIVKTGMIIKKANNIIGRIILFGDCVGNGIIDVDDLTQYSKVCTSQKTYDNAKLKEYQIVSMDVNHDGKVNGKDSHIIGQISGLLKENDIIQQDVYADDFNSIEIQFEKEFVRENIDYISEEFRTSYNFHYDEEKRKYIVNIDSSTEVTAGEMLTKLNNSMAYVIIDGEIIEDTDSTEVVINNSRVVAYVYGYAVFVTVVQI